MFRLTSADQPNNLPTFSSLEIVWLENAPLNDIKYPDLYSSAQKYSSSPAPFRESLYCMRPPEASVHGEHGTPGGMTGPPTPHCSPAAQALQCASQNSIRGPAGEGGGLISGACQVKPHLPASVSSAHTSKLEATASRRSLRPLTSQWMDASLTCMTQST